MVHASLNRQGLDAFWRAMIKADCFLASKGYVLADFREVSLSPPPLVQVHHSCVGIINVSYIILLLYNK
jgi:hypothetical protein